jgi:type IV pilus assembly protein PilN
MANFNLLPWREAEREQKKKQFFSIVGVCALTAAGIAFGAHLFMQNRIEYQQSRNAYLTAEIKKMDKKIKEIEELEKTRQALIDHIKVIEDLQSTRPAIVHLFDEMAKALPQGMYISKIQQKNTLVTVEGKAESNARVSSYMNRLDSSPWLKSSDLNIIASESEKDQVGDIRLKDFRLQVTQLLKHSNAKEIEARENELKKQSRTPNNRKTLKRGGKR